ncbi:hypothetical protein [uncultured Sulfitobacter sp.]|uniref:hypothetical protein n=1 Tax=uncultured Sulfitobacter sp. TaxID=191468 RepID=UPI00260A1C1F|nr:hypothetical protein [uncultured Sulfitobacter sp.]
MNSIVRKYSPYSVRIASLAAIGAYICQTVAFSSGNSLSMFNLVFFIGWALFSLITLIFAPFALLALWRVFWSNRTQIRMPKKDEYSTENVTLMDVIDLFQFAGQAAKKYAPSGLTWLHARTMQHLTRHRAAMRFGAQKVSAQVRKQYDIGLEQARMQSSRLSWPKIWRETLWYFAALVLTLLPLIVIIIGIVILEHLGPRVSDTKDMVRSGILFAVPFAFFIGVVLKTKFDMPRKLTYSPDFLYSFGKFTMISGPISLIVVLVVSIMLIPVTAGWSVVLPIVYAYKLFGLMMALAAVGAVLTLIGQNMGSKQVDLPQPSPKPDPRWMDDPIWTEMP